MLLTAVVVTFLLLISLRVAFAQTAIISVDTTGDVGQRTSLAFGNDGLPVISYYDVTNGDLKVVKCGNATCSSGNVFTVVDPTINGSTNDTTSIAIPADGLPIIAYHQRGTLGSPDGYHDLKVVKCGTPTCSSGNTITLVDTANSTGFGPSVAIGSDGLPVISYVNYTNGDLKVAKCGNAACSSGNTLTTVQAGDAGDMTSIAIGADGLPVIAYKAWISPDYELKVAKCGNTACSSGNTFTFIDTDGETWYTAIAKGSDGLPVIAYIDWDNDRLKVAKCGNATCSAGNTITTVDTSADRWPSITMASDGLPIISYGKSFDLKVVKCDNAACSSGNTITVIDTSSDPNVGFTSIKVAPDTLPIISYYDSGLDDLKVAKCDTANCAAAPSPSATPSPSPSPSCSAPVILTHSDSNPTGGGTVSFTWNNIPQATRYKVQRQNPSGTWLTKQISSSTNFVGNDGSNDPNWRVFVSLGTCSPIPGPSTVFDP